ncbi:MAG: hypothetical protein ABSD39_12130 [Terriglobales bacterium]|jgi:hypothetical protein
MKRFVLSFVVLAFFVGPQWLLSQASENHVEIGAFADYFRLDRTSPDINFVGVGGRVGFNVKSYMQLEAEMAYDFDRNYTSTYDNGISSNLVSSRSHVLHALFGPKFQTGSGPVRFFATAKAGLISFSTSNQNAPDGFQNSLGAVGNGNAKFAVYPAVGLEGFAGPIGLRLEAGDDIYFDNGARNNLRVTFGPVFRF